MPAYSFQPCFVEPIRAGSKGGTIRAARRRGNVRGYGRSAQRAAQFGGHAFPDEQLSLYCRQRQPTGFLIDRKSCLATVPVLLDFADGGRVVIGRQAHTIHAAIGLDTFARFDGFECWDEMRGFWQATHRVDHFRGWHVRWLPLPAMLGYANG